MILTSNRTTTAIPKMKKKLFLEPLEESSLASTVSCEFGPDGIKFVRANINITKNGMCKIIGDQITPLSVVKSEDVEFGAEIGRGASGFVQEGIYKPENFPIAIKTMNVYDKDKRHQVVNDLKNFLQDRLDQVKGNDTELSNFVVQVYGAYYDEGSIRIIMELMDAGSLRGVLNMAKKIQKKGSPCIEEAYLANIAYQMLSGLHFIHTKKKQIHRDIKPENVLMNSLGQVKLTDFGISKQLEQTHAFSKTFVGTVTYMSPERLIGDNYAFSSDMWSVGLVLIELATGEYPYKKTKTFIEMLQNITSSPEPNLPDNGLYSDEFRDFVTRCLSKDPKNRRTAAELLEHPWLLKNSELNLDISEWVSNLLFTCKYGYKGGDMPNIEEMEAIEEEIEMHGEKSLEAIPEELNGMNNGGGGYEDKEWGKNDSFIAVKDKNKFMIGTLNNKYIYGNTQEDVGNQMSFETETTQESFNKKAPKVEFNMFNNNCRNNNAMDLEIENLD